MLGLVDTIDEVLSQDGGNHRGISDESTQFIKALLVNDTLFNSIHPSIYDCVLVTILPVEIGTRIMGVTFFDKKKRFKDGCGILTSHVKSVTKLRHELYRVETNNSVYIVVMK
jgi:hypothetical protein